MAYAYFASGFIGELFIRRDRSPDTDDIVDDGGNHRRRTKDAS
jgi:hypothetical protein